jgi:ribosome biogenesis GTPase
MDFAKHQDKDAACQGDVKLDTPPDTRQMTGRVVSLDRGFPLVDTLAGETRSQHSIELVKNTDTRAVVGDLVDLELPPGQDTPLITAIHPRGHTLVRRSLVESRHEGAGKHEEQVLAANIDIVFVVCALSNRRVDVAYLERQLVMAHESGARVVIVLTKADLAAHRDDDIACVRALAFDSPIIVESAVTGEGLSSIVTMLEGGRIGVLLGRSGVGKSTLINELLGAPLLETGAVRAKDRAGRHTTVARRMVFLGARDDRGTDGDRGTYNLSSRQDQEKSLDDRLYVPLSPPPGGALIDTPGLRSIGLYDAYEGLAAAFPDITTRAAHCRYRDCTHTSEPDCAVRAAVEDGSLPAARLASYVTLAHEVND